MNSKGREDSREGVYGTRIGSLKLSCKDRDANLLNSLGALSIELPAENTNLLARPIKVD